MERIEFIEQKYQVLVPLTDREIIAPRSEAFFYSSIARRFDLDAEATANFLNLIFPLMDCAAIKSIPKIWRNERDPFWDNGYFYGPDMRALFAVLSLFKPETYFEIGSGNSTKLARYAIDQRKLDTKIVSLDPLPRTEIDNLCNEVIRENLLDCPLDRFEKLKPGDILFCDGSHLTLNGTDTIRFWLEILPILKPGVLIHIHDIHLPYEYDSSFDGRGYSEQYMLGAALLNSDSLEVLLPINYLSKTGKIPWRSGPGGGSFWFQKKTA